MKYCSITTIPKTLWITLLPSFQWSECFCVSGWILFGAKSINLAHLGLRAADPLNEEEREVRSETKNWSPDVKSLHVLPVWTKVFLLHWGIPGYELECEWLFVLHVLLRYANILSWVNPAFSGWLLGLAPTPAATLNKIELSKPQRMTHARANSTLSLWICF